MAGRDAIGSGRADELELEDDAALAVLSSLLQAPRPRAALRAMPATSSFLVASLGVVIGAPCVDRCRALAPSTISAVSIGRCRSVDAGGIRGGTGKRIARNRSMDVAATRRPWSRRRTDPAARSEPRR